MSNCLLQFLVDALRTLQYAVQDISFIGKSERRHIYTYSSHNMIILEQRSRETHNAVCIMVYGISSTFNLYQSVPELTLGI